MKTLRVVGLVLLSLTLLVGSTRCSNSDTTPPSTPANLTKTSPDNSNKPTFTWDAASDKGSGIGCYIVRIEDEGWYQYWIFNGESTAFTCEVPISDGSHTFEVKAVDKAGNEGNTASLSFTCDTT
jgi:hypothetical protein